MATRRSLLPLLVVLITLFAHTKDQPAQVIAWPESGQPIVRFSFGKFKELGALGGQHSYVIDTTAENVWGKKISRMGFSLYLFDKNKVRIGEGWVTLSDVPVGQSVKFQTTVGTSGTPVSLELVANSLPAELQPLAPPKIISITVNSVPQGAALKVDGGEGG